jgi:O-antigen/teichoic acid export membrane protein
MFKKWREFSWDNVHSLQLFQIIRFGTTFLISILLVKSGMATKDIAFYEVLLFLSNFLSFAWVMGLKNGLLSYFPSIEREDRDILIFNLGLVLIVLAVLTALGLYIFYPFLVENMTQYSFIPHIPLICVFIVFSAPAVLTEFIYLLYNKDSLIRIYAVSIYAVQFLLIALVVFLGLGLYHLILVLVIWSVIRFIWFIQVILQYGKIKIDLKKQWQFIVFSAPLILHVFLGNGMEYIDGFLVTRFFEEEQFAIFRYGARELPIVSMLLGALSMALIPEAVGNMEKALLQIKKRTGQMMRWMYTLSIGLMLLSPFLFPLIYSAEFKSSAILFNFYILIISSRILLPQVVLYGFHKNNFLLLSTILELILNVVLSLWWLGYFGLIGIVAATVVSYLFHKLLLIAYNKWKFNISFSEYVDVKPYLIYNALLYLAFAVSCYY